jgi:regulator of RNase E activity RraA
VVDFRCSIEFSNGTMVRNGDVIVGDIDGVLTIPAEALSDVVAAALEKSGAERKVQLMIEAGETTTDIFARTGIM